MIYEGEVSIWYYCLIGTMFFLLFGVPLIIRSYLPESICLNWK